ncbi:MAG: quinoprotein dehydrogenase-associated SoxYZ-like carrier [Kiloniellales bacterium]
MLMSRRLLAALAVWLLAAGTALAAAPEHDPWTDLREALFEQRPIAEDGSVIALEAPYRAYDAAIVPITMKALQPQEPERYIKTLTLVIDKNPAPVAAVFHLSPLSGDATIATRVRVNEYTNVRAIAELNDGSLHMASKFVKAAGGCSAPALKDQEASLARLGKIKLKQTAAGSGQPRQAQLLISHPNYSGLQMDQLTRHYIPADFVQDIEVSHGGQTILTVEGAISLSEDPSIHFSFLPQGPTGKPGDISVWVRDTEGRVFEGSWPLDSPAGS